MANAAAVHACVFRWDIYDIFLRWRDLETTFYQGSPAVTQWKATLQPLVSSTDNWEFLFSVEFIERLDHRQEVVADRLQVRITLNDTVITRHEVANQRFWQDNWFKYRFQSNASISPQTEPHHLEVIIEISLPGTARENEEGNGLFFLEDDLRSLSRDLSLLRTDPRFCNMILIPSDSQQPIYIHSYIIHARWSNFFEVHNFQVDVVRTNISHALLMDILVYMYSGTIGLNWPDWKNSAYTTELFKVIDRYKLYHLYKVFVKSDLLQLRVTRKPVSIQTHLCPLNFINGRQITDATHTWRVENNPELSFRFIVRNENQAGPWLSYTLKSTSSSRVYAKVSLKVLKMVDGLSEAPLLFHEDDFFIGPNSTRRGRCVLFLGCPETFGRFESEGIKYFIQCNLSLDNGLAVEQIRSVDDDTLLNDMARFGVLSDHMRQLRNDRTYDDMTIQSRLEDQDEHGLLYQEVIHKGIFAIRVPEWWKGLANIPQSNNLPGLATSILSEDALPIVHDYMYTGKLFTVPTRAFLDEIERFAEETRFASLLDLVNRIRLHLTEQ